MYPGLPILPIVSQLAVIACRQGLPNAVFTRPNHINPFVVTVVFHLHKKTQRLLNASFFPGNHIFNIQQLDFIHPLSPVIAALKCRSERTINYLTMAYYVRHMLSCILKPVGFDIFPYS